MSLLFADSFDHYTDLSKKWDSIVSNGIAPPTIVSGAARTGGFGFRSGPSTTDNGSNAAHSFALKNLGGGKKTVIVGFAFNPTVWAASPTNGWFRGKLLSFIDQGFEQCSIRVVGDGQLAVYNSHLVSTSPVATTDTQLGISTRALTLGVYRYIEVKATIDDSVGTVEILVDGVSWLSLTGIDTRDDGLGDYATSVAFSLYPVIEQTLNGSTTLAFDMDDVYICDDQGSYNNDFLGDVAIYMALPTGNGGTVDLTRGGTDSGANWSQVEENPPDGDTTYNYSGTPGDLDRYTYPPIAGVVIPAVCVTMYARKDDGTARSIQGTAKLGVDEADSGIDLPLSLNYFTYQGILERDPAGNAWTQANVAAAEFGPKVTV